MTGRSSKTIRQVLGREPVHPFPARMAPGIALDIISASCKPIRILDPMMGSGTVLAVARANGHKAMGIDIDPLAVLISRVWTTAINPDEIKSKAIEILKKARIQSLLLSTTDSYPSNADKETRKFIRYWFDDYSRLQLASLAQVIRGIRHDRHRDVFWCAFSRLIITKENGASLARDLSHSRPHRSFDRAPEKPFKNFLLAVDHVIKNCVHESSKNRGPATYVRLGDARRLSLKAETIDLVLTSPPYLNAIDYMRCSKFSLIWMGSQIEEVRKIRSHSVGTEAHSNSASSNVAVREVISELGLNPKLDERRQAMLARYVYDMMLAIKEATRVLVPGGTAVYVVGENTIRGTFIRNSRLVSMVAESAGLNFSSKYSRKLPENRRYLPPPARGMNANGLNGRMRKEVVLTFTK